MHNNEVMNVIYEELGIIESSNEEVEYLNEGKLKQIFMGLSIRPHQNIDVTLKKHEYPGYLNYIKKCKDIDDLKYLRRDISQGINTINTIMSKIEKGTDTKFSKKGITVKDCKATIKWFEDVARKTINDRIKELKNK